MQYNLQPEDAELLDTWITARFVGREQIASLPDLSSQGVELTALANDLLSLAEDIEPDEDFVIHLEASLRRKLIAHQLSSFANPVFVEAEEIENLGTER